MAALALGVMAAIATMAIIMYRDRNKNNLPGEINQIYKKTTRRLSQKSHNYMVPEDPSPILDEYYLEPSSNGATTAHPECECKTTMLWSTAVILTAAYFLRV